MAPPALSVAVNWARKKAYEDAVVTLAPLAYYRCSDNPLGLSAFDRVMNYPATISGTVTSGTGLLVNDPDAAFVFDGSSGYLATSAVTLTGAGLTLSAIVKPTAIPSGTNKAGIIGAYSAATDQAVLRLGGTTVGKVDFTIGQAVERKVTGTTTLANGTTYHVLATYDGANMRLFVNGVLDGVSAQTGNFTSTAALEVGRHNAGSYFTGTIDEAWVSTTATTTLQAHSLYLAWAQGEFGGPYDSIAATRVETFRTSRGRNADFSGEATGSLEMSVLNADGFFTSRRNLATDGAFANAGDAESWSVAAIASVVSAPTSMTIVADGPTGSGCSWSAELSLPAVSGAGVTLPLVGVFYSGVPYYFEVAIKSISGTTSVEVGAASSGTPADIAASGSTITGSWARYGVAWTPSADRTDAVLFVRSRAASVAVARFGAAQVNEGSTALTYLFGPTGGAVSAKGTYSATDYGLYFGWLERVTPDPVTRTATLLAYDALARIAAIDTSVAVVAGRSARTYRAALIDAAVRRMNSWDANRHVNGGFETDTSGWTSSGCTLTRDTSTSKFGAASLKALATGAGACQVTYTDTQTYMSVNAYSRVSFWMRSTGSPTAVALWFSNYNTFTRIPLGSGLAGYPALTASWQKYTLVTLGGGTLTTQFIVYFTAGGASDGVYIDGVQITDGAAGADYTPAGDAGLWRATNILGNPSGEIDSMGWTGLGGNLCPHGGPDNSATGWVATANSFITIAGGSITAPGGQLLTVSITCNGNYGGVSYALTGSFASGVARTVRWTTGTGAAFAVGIGSNGTPADYAQATLSAGSSGSFTWTPSGTRTDAILFIRANTGGLAYNLQVRIWVDAPSTFTRVTNDAQSPAGCFQMVTAAEIGSGAHIAVPFENYMTLHRSGKRKTFGIDLWTTSGTASVALGMIGDATGVDPASRTVTVTTTRSRFYLAWTPTADRTAPYAIISAAAASAYTVRMAGAHVATASAALPCEPAETALDPTDLDIMFNSAGGNIGSLLSDINKATLGRHFIRPLVTRPWWRYVSVARLGWGAKTVAESVADDATGATGFDSDRSAVVNSVIVSHAAAAHYTPDVGIETGTFPETIAASDPASIANYGYHEETLGNANFINAPTNAARTAPYDGTAFAIANTAVSRYSVPRARPKLVTLQRWPSQLAREPDDLLAVTFARQSLAAGRYLIQAIELAVTDGGLRWEEALQLEEAPPVAIA